MVKKILSILTLSALIVTPAAARVAKKNKSAAPAQAASAPAAASAAASASAPSAPKLNAAEALKQPEIAASAYLVRDLQSNQTLVSKNADQQIEPASLTKLMTAYIAFKALEEGKLKPDQKLTVSEKAWKVEGSRMFLKAHSEVPVWDLMRGLIVVSGNDAAITLAEGIAGSEEAFAKMMNDEAKRLGMTQTYFENATGLPAPKHLTSANDLAILSAAIIRDLPAKYYEIYSYKSYTYNNITQENRNLLLFRDDSVDGLKTGHTSSAGYNLIATSKRNNRRVISIVIGAASAEARATESSKLLNYALQGFDTPKMYQAGQVVSKVRVYKGAVSEAEVGFQQDAYVTLPQGQGDKVKTVLETMQPVVAPVQAGQKIGTLKLMDGDKVLAEQPVVALKDVGEAGFFGRLWDSIVLWFKSVFAG